MGKMKTIFLKIVSTAYLLIFTAGIFVQSGNIFNTPIPDDSANRISVWFEYDNWLQSNSTPEKRIKKASLQQHYYYPFLYTNNIPEFGVSYNERIFRNSAGLVRYRSFFTTLFTSQA